MMVYINMNITSLKVRTVKERFADTNIVIIINYYTTY